jgi:hypothetical protein
MTDLTPEVQRIVDQIGEDIASGDAERAKRWAGRSSALAELAAECRTERDRAALMAALKDLDD